SVRRGRAIGICGKYARHHSDDWNCTERKRVMCGRHQKKGFTLIELLVVIAIIAILAAILFPVFAQARDKARQATCTSNLRQIGNAFQLYIQDHDGRAPTNCNVIGGADTTLNYLRNSCWPGWISAGLAP